jgi:hypothetical protein
LFLVRNIHGEHEQMVLTIRCLIVYDTIFIFGGGKYSIDQMIAGKKRKK